MIKSWGFDAGTDSGELFTSPNEATSPKEAIHVLDKPTDAVYNAAEMTAKPMTILC